MKRCSLLGDQATLGTQAVWEVNVVLQIVPSEERGSYKRICLSADDASRELERGDQDADRYAFCPTISCRIPHN